MRVERQVVQDVQLNYVNHGPWSWYDQRGQVRPLSGAGLTACDAGAFEYQPQVFVPLVRR